jgi:sugar O-acyltransferase (sialic acid O-acetyltransferase NeuD family)
MTQLNLIGFASGLTLDMAQVAIDQKYDVTLFHNGPMFEIIEIPIKRLDTLDLNISSALGLVTPKSRFDLFQKVEMFGKTSWINLVSEDAKVSPTSQLFEGVFINNGVVVASKAVVARHAIINRLAGIGHHSTISEFAFIGPGAQILGNCVIGKGSYVGAGSVILEGVKVGDNSIVGAGSVVTKNVPSNEVVYGNPAKFVRENGL